MRDSCSGRWWTAFLALDGHFPDSAGIGGMAEGFEHQLANPETYDLTFEERIGLLVDRELASRDTRRLQRLLRGRGCGRLRVWRTSTTGIRAGSTSGCASREVLDARFFLTPDLASARNCIRGLTPPLSRTLRGTTAGGDEPGD